MLLKSYKMKDFMFFLKKWVYNFKMEKHKYAHHWKNVKHEFLILTNFEL